MTDYFTAALDKVETAEAARREALKEAAQIIEARLPLYSDLGQINALRECLSSILYAASKPSRAGRLLDESPEARR